MCVNNRIHSLVIFTQAANPDQGEINDTGDEFTRSGFKGGQDLLASGLLPGWDHITVSFIYLK